MTVIAANLANNPITFSSSTVAVGSSPRGRRYLRQQFDFRGLHQRFRRLGIQRSNLTAPLHVIQDSSAAGPDSIAINPVTNQVYVANLASANATVITLGSPNNVVSDVSLASGGSAIAVDVVTNIAYSADTVSGTIGVINGNSLPPTSTGINLTSGGSSPQEVAVNPVTHRAYVANYNTPGSITVLDGATSITTDIPTSVALTTAIAVDPATNLIFVADRPTTTSR